MWVLPSGGVSNASISRTARRRKARTGPSVTDRSAWARAPRAPGSSRPPGPWCPAQRRSTHHRGSEVIAPASQQGASLWTPLSLLVRTSSGALNLSRRQLDSQPPGVPWHRAVRPRPRPIGGPRKPSREGVPTRGDRDAHATPPSRGCGEVVAACSARPLRTRTGSPAHVRADSSFRPPAGDLQRAVADSHDGMPPGEAAACLCAYDQSVLRDLDRDVLRRPRTVPISTLGMRRAAPRFGSSRSG
jgi:hypothetical protein